MNLLITKKVNLHSTSLAKNKSSHIYPALFAYICMLIFLGGLDRYLTYLSVAISACVAVYIAKVNIINESEQICTGIIFLLVIQNVCIGLGAHLSGNEDPSLKLLTQIPFMVITIIWAIEILNGIKYIDKRILYSFILLTLCIAISALSGYGGLQSSLVSVRNMTVFFMAYSIGAINGRNKQENIVRYIIITSATLTILGFLIQLGGYDLYRAIGIHEVYIAKAAPFNEQGLPGRFYTSLFSNISYERMGSIIYEPINLSYYLALGLVCTIYNEPWNLKLPRLFYIIICSIGLFLTFGKGGYIIAIFIICCTSLEILGSHSHSKTVKNNISIITVAAITAVFMIFVIYYVNHIGLAVMNHIYAIRQTWSSICSNPLGYGIGTGGNAANSLGNVSQDDWFSSGGETALLSFGFQIGLQGIIAIVLCFYFMSIIQVKKKTSKLDIVFFYIPIILLIVSIFQDNTFTPQCIVPYMLLQGALEARL